MKYIMKVHNVKYYLAYATSALREAENSDTIISKIKNDTGIGIEIIDGLREARIISNAKPIEKNNPFRKNLYVDVGGGSTELSFVQNGEKTISKSFNIGTVRDLNKGDDIMVDQSYSERQLFEKAYERILSEFQIILKISSEDTQKKLNKALKRNLENQTKIPEQKPTVNPENQTNQEVMERTE